MNNTVLTDEQITNIIEDIAWPNEEVMQFGETVARTIEKAVLQSPEIQALYGLLKESRHQLPLAAQFWNEDDDSERGRRNVRHVLELIAMVDAAMEGNK